MYQVLITSNSFIIIFDMEPLEVFSQGQISLLLWHCPSAKGQKAPTVDHCTVGTDSVMSTNIW